MPPKTGVFTAKVARVLSALRHPFLCMISVILLPLLIHADDSTDTNSRAVSLLKACLATQRQTDWISFRGLTSTIAKSKQGPSKLEFALYVRKRDGLLDIECERRANDENTGPSKLNLFPKRFVANSDLYATYIHDANGEIIQNSLVIAQAKLERERQSCLESANSFGPVDGYMLCAGARRVAEVMLESSDLTNVGTELVGDVECTAVEATTPFGIYKLWLDVDCGALPRKATMFKRADDLNWDGNKLSETIVGKDGLFETERRSELSGIELIQVDNIWVVSRAKLLSSYARSNGVKGNSELDLQRQDILFRPSFENSGVFQVHFKDGTIVTNEDDRTSGARYEIKSGKVVSAEKEIRQVERPAERQNPRGWLLRLFVALNAVVIVIAGLWFYFRRRP